MRFKEVMHTELHRPKRDGFDKSGCEKDIEEMQTAVEQIAGDADWHGLVDLKQMLDTVYNRLEDCLWYVRCDVDDPDSGGYYDEEDDDDFWNDEEEDE